MLKVICMSVQLSEIAENTKVCFDMRGREYAALGKDASPTATAACWCALTRDGCQLMAKSAVKFWEGFITPVCLQWFRLRGVRDPITHLCSCNLCCFTNKNWGYAVAQLVETLLYKSEGCGFDSRLCHCNFSLT